MPPRKCFHFSNISSIQWGLDAVTAIKAEKRKTEKISLPDNMCQWQCPFQNKKEEQGGGNMRKLPCWSCINHAVLQVSACRSPKWSSPVSFSSWQWALLSLGILSLCGIRHGTSAPPKWICLPLFQLSAVEYKAPLPSHHTLFTRETYILKLRTTGGRRREALEINLLSKILSLLSAGTCLPFLLMHILVLIGNKLY